MKKGSALKQSYIKKGGKQTYIWKKATTGYTFKYPIRRHNRYVRTVKRTFHDFGIFLSR